MRLPQSPILGLGFRVAVLLLAVGSARAQTLSFSQLSFELDGTTTWTDTEYGCAKFDYVGQSGISYLNLSINGSWQVQNAPIINVDGLGVAQGVAIDFDLGSVRGTPVSSLQYGFSLTSTALTSMPAGSVTAPVTSEWTREWGGLDDQVMFSLLPPARPYVGGAAAAPAAHTTGSFPNQQCHKNECVPASVSNSLQYLKKEKKLFEPDDRLTIDKMKPATGWDADGCWTYDGTHKNSSGQTVNHVAWWKLKDYYLTGHGYAVTTRMISSISDLIAEIDDHQDIELIYSWTNADGKKGAHAVNVTSITPLADGRYDLQLQSDWDQKDDSAGCYARKYTYDPTTGMLDGGRYGVRKFEYAVVECPEPASLSLLMLAAGATLSRRTRRIT